MFLSGRMDKENVVHVHNGVLPYRGKVRRWALGWELGWNGQVNIPGNAKDLMGRLEGVWRWKKKQEKFGKGGKQEEGTNRKTQREMEYWGFQSQGQTQ